MPSPIWYLAHPVAPDEQFTTEQNLDHAVKMFRLCWEEGYRVIAPWHTMCLAFSEDSSYREAGLEMDCENVAQVGRLILTGHKMSSGMALEYRALAKVNGRAISLIGMDSFQAREVLRQLKEEHNGG